MPIILAPNDFSEFNTLSSGFKPYESDEEFNIDLEKNVRKELQEWSFLNDYNLVDIKTSELLSLDVEKDLAKFAKDMKSEGFTFNRRFEFEAEILDHITKQNTDYTLILHIDHINFEKWLHQNEGDPDYFYSNPQRFRGASTEGGLAGLLGTIVGGPIVGIISEVATNSAINSETNYNHIQLVSAYLIDNSDGDVVWSTKKTYQTQLGGNRTMISWLLEQENLFFCCNKR